MYHVSVLYSCKPACLLVVVIDSVKLKAGKTLLKETQTDVIKQLKHRGLNNLIAISYGTVVSAVYFTKRSYSRDKAT